MDVMEIFRTLMWEMPLVGSLNRGQWNEDADFELRPGHVWLSDDGRKRRLACSKTDLPNRTSIPIQASRWSMDEWSNWKYDCWRKNGPAVQIYLVN